MSRIATCLLMLVMVSLPLVSCGDDDSTPDARVEAYNAAVERVKRAGSSEELLEISYSLFLELDSIDAIQGGVESRSIKSARLRFEEEVGKREMEFYTAMGKQKK